MNRKITGGLVSVLLIFASSQIAFGYTITTFAPSVFNSDTAAMDASLGIDESFDIEGFEDTQLLSGLQVELRNPDRLASSTLPGLYDPLVPKTGDANGFQQHTWDGAHSLINTTNNDIDTAISPFPPFSDVFFHLDNGATAFGVGLSDFQTSSNRNSTLLINGQDHGFISTLPGFVEGFQRRNLYLMITADPGDELIESVGFDMGSARVEILVFDHVAIQSAVPEPNSLLLSFLALTCVVAFRNVR